MGKYPADSHYLKAMKTILDSYPQHSPPLHPTQLTDQLFIGNQDNADDTVLLQDLGISYVLNCVGSRNFDLTRSPYPPEVNVKGFLIIPAQDFDEFNIMQYFDDAIGFIDSGILSGGKVLVHCSIGVNRSGAIVAAYMMISQKKKLLDVIVELKAKRLLVLCNMGFRKQLVQFARANELLDEVEFEEEENKEEKEEHAKEESSYRGIQSEKDGFKSLYDDGMDSVDEIRIKEKVIDLKALARKGYTSKQKIETLEEAKGVMVWSQLKDEEKLDLLSDKLVCKGAEEGNSGKYSNMSSLKNFKNVDPAIVFKVMNDSYDRYKKGVKLYKSPLEYKYSNNKKFDNKSLFRQNLDSKMKNNELELNQEVDNFLSSTSSPISKKYSDVRKLLDPHRNKDDEKTIYGKASSLKDTKDTSSSSGNSSKAATSKRLHEISQYVTDQLPSQRPSEIINRISSRHVKPLSYYKLQVLNEQLSTKSTSLPPSSSSSSSFSSYRPPYRPSMHSLHRSTEFK